MHFSSPSSALHSMPLLLLPQPFLLRIRLLLLLQLLLLLLLLIYYDDDCLRGGQIWRSTEFSVTVAEARGGLASPPCASTMRRVSRHAPSPEASKSAPRGSRLGKPWPLVSLAGDLARACFFDTLSASTLLRRAAGLPLVEVLNRAVGRAEMK